MHLANSTISIYKTSTFFIFCFFITQLATAQENSPYSRFGLGDVVPAQNMASRGMGGISAGFVDGMSVFQSINLNNPASLPYLGTTTLDIGGEIDTRVLKSNNSPSKYRATNTLISYLQLGFPITPQKMKAKGYSWVAALGLKPVTRINYKVEQNVRVSGIDSVNTLFEGNGGVSQANISSGIKYKNFSFGFTTGYSFGNRNVSTQKRFVNDSIAYKFSNTEASARFGALFLNLGAQYAISINKKTTLRLGATANLQQNLKATRNDINQTILYGADGSIFSIDTVTFNREQQGIINLPSSYTFGFTVTNDHWVVGADIDYANWAAYRYFGKNDPLQNSYKFRVGAQYFPADVNTTSKNKLIYVKYRAGFFYGNDYIKLTTNRPEYGFTVGAGIPLTNPQRYRYGEFVTLNTGAEIGQRGNRTNVSFRENVFRVNIGITMSASNWFQKRKYD